jgi:hypothetical protein
MRKQSSFLLAALLLTAAPIVAAEPAASEPPMVREIYVPFEDLHVLLDGNPRRVFLERKEYEDLLAKAKPVKPEAKAPQAVVLVAAEYAGTAEEERVRLTGQLDVEVLEDGLHAVPLDLGGVGVRSATIGDASAAIGLNEAGAPVLFVSGKGRKRLTLEMVTPLQTQAAQQTLSLRLPIAAATRLRLTVPGNVDVKSGAKAVSREVDEKAAVTRFELLPTAGQTTIVMSLNNRILRRQRVVVARSVLVDEVTVAQERLHATVSLEVLQGAADRFRFLVPEGFEPAEVLSPQLARWVVEKADGKRFLEIVLREPAMETVVVNVAAVRTPARLTDWTMPLLTAQDVAGQIAVVGLVAEDRLTAESLDHQSLTPIDNAILTGALPDTLFRAEPGAPRVRPVAAYYAPTASYTLKARFATPPARVKATTNLLLSLQPTGQQLHGGFTLLPEIDKLFAVRFSLPSEWHVKQVTAADGAALPFERYAAGPDQSLVRVRLPKGVPPGERTSVLFQAVYVPPGWLGAWPKQAVTFPAVVVQDSAADIGAIAVRADDDYEVRPGELEALTPLDEKEKEKYGLKGVASNLAYRYESQPYKAALAVERKTPSITARCFSFLNLTTEGLAADYELVYDIQQARTDRLTFRLPKNAPAALSVSKLDDVEIKESSSQFTDTDWLWTVQLAQPRLGVVRLAVGFKQPLSTEKLEDYALPLIRADGVSYQSAVVAVEGSADLDIDVQTEARRVDVGELVAAQHRVGRRLLGAYTFAGEERPVTVNVSPRPGYAALPAALVQRAELVTLLAASGKCQTAARYQLRTKALLLEVQLPADAEFWSAYLDGAAVAPQRDGERLLLNLPADNQKPIRDLQLVYESPVAALALLRSVATTAPSLWLRDDRSGPAVEVLAADMKWTLVLPNGHRLVRSSGTVFTTSLPPRRWPLAVAGEKLYGMLSGWVTIQIGGQTLPSPYYLDDSIRYYHDTHRDFPPGAAGPGMYMRGPGVDGPGPGGMGGMGGGERRHALDLGLAPKAGAERFDLSALAKEAPARDEAGRPAHRLADRDKREEESEKAEAPKAEARPEPKTAAAPPAKAPPAKEPVPPMLGQPGMSAPRARADGEDPFAAPAQKAPATPPPQTESQPSPSQEQTAAEQEDSGVDQSKSAKYWALEGVRSLRIDLQRTGTQVDFESLGDHPRLQVTLASERQIESLAWGVAIVVFLAGAWFTCRSARAKAGFVIAVALTALLVPVLTGLTHELGDTFDMGFYAACCLVPYYLLIALAKWLSSRCCGHECCRAAAPLALLLIGVAGSAWAQPATPPPALDAAALAELLAPSKPVSLPEDAVILPYNPDAGAQALKDAQKVLVPYDKYVELWNRAHPDKKLEVKPPVVPFSLAGAAYQATLAEGDQLLVTGHIAVDVFAEKDVAVPLRLSGGVLTSATVDGKPARLQFVRPEPPPAAQQPAQQAQQQRAQPAPQPAANAPASAAVPPGKPVDAEMILLYLTDQGRKRLEVAIRMPLERRGGWRLAAGRLPAAPATSLALSVPSIRTEVRLTGVADRTTYETTADNQRIETALNADGAAQLQWRPKVAEAQVDRSLTVNSEALLDVQEDGLRVHWRLDLSFPRARRDAFTIWVPAEYLVEKVQGDNVRGWQTQPDEKRQRVEVTLLKEVQDRETITLRLSRRGVVQTQAPTQLDAPVVAVASAVQHKGRLTIRRSPLLELRSANVSGLSRTDLPAEFPKTAGAEENPLGLQPYQALQFESTPFTVRLTALPPPPSAGTATVQSLLRIAAREARLETRVLIQGSQRPIHRVRLYVPQNLEIEQVSAPGDFVWSPTTDPRGRLLSIYLSAGQRESCSVLVSGSLGRRQAETPVPAPRIEVLDVTRQQGDLVVQLDPAFDVRLTDKRNCDSVLLSRVFSWLQADQRPLARLALHYDNVDYAATLQVTPRRADVSGFTVTNVKVTDVAVEETVVIDLTIKEAGIREVVLRLPPSLEKARIRVPMLRQTIKEDAPGGWKRVRLQLQDEVTNQLRVVIENDRLLRATKPPATPGGTAPEEEAGDEAPIPILETGRTDRRYVTLEKAGRDEVVVVKHQQLEPLDRQQSEWQKLAEVLGNGITRAYIVQGEAAEPQLTFKTAPRKTVETAGASIGLAETLLIVDASGAYRGQQVYHVNNTTEDFLVVQLPAGATLWTATVAGEPVKPAEVPGGQAPNQVRIPLIKTAEGDRDYAVVLKYGGRLRPVGAVDRIAFPLPHTVNINVELSQVRLRLPPTHQWFNFGGTMERLTDEGEFQAKFLSYGGKQIKRLQQGLTAVNPYARVRSSSNIKNLAAAMQQQQDLYANFSGNSAFKSNWDANTAVLQQAEQQADVLLLDQSQSTATLDNRGRLNDFYDAQQNGLARNVVVDLGDNFRVAVQEDKAQVQTFNEEWLEQNKLRSGLTKAPGKSGDRVQTKGGQKGADLKKQIAEQTLIQGLVKGDQDQKGQQSQKPTGQRQYNQSQQELTREYQQRLQTDNDMSYNLPAQQSATGGAAWGSLPGGQRSGQGQRAGGRGPGSQPSGGEQARAPLQPQLQPGMAYGGPANAPPTMQPPPGMMMPGYGIPAANQPMAMPGGVPGPGMGMMPPATTAPTPPPAVTLRNGAVAFSPDGRTLQTRPATGAGSGEGRPSSSFRGVAPQAGQQAQTAAPQSSSGAVQIVDGTAQQVQMGETPPPVAVLASLDVDLPQRGVEFLFTTPRGEIEITARAVSGSAVDRLQHLLAILATAVALYAAYRVLRRIGPDLLNTMAGSALLVILGGASLCLGLLPLVGVVILVVGLVQLVRLSLVRIRRRRAAAAA